MTNTLSFTKAYESFDATTTATWSPSVVNSMSASISSLSLLKIGSDKSTILPDLLNFVVDAEYTIDPSSTVTDLNYTADAKRIRLHATRDTRILRLKGQKYVIQNDSDSSITVSHHYVGSGNEHCNDKTIKLAPRGTVVFE